MAALKKIAEVRYGPDVVHVSCNGRYCLVSNRGPDAYGTPIWQEIPAEQLDMAEVVHLLGKAHEEIVDLKADLAKVHAALQRESEPDRPKPKPAAREAGTMAVAGILEEKP